MFVPKKVSKMTLAELQAERDELLPVLKKMKRKAAPNLVELNKMRRRNLLLKDEICRRKDLAKISIEKQPAMQLAA